MKKGELVEELEVVGVSADGNAVAKKEGAVIFLRGVVPGDIVEARVLKKKKNAFLGRVEKITSKSENRAEPFCSHFGLCGGCKWQNMSYESQLIHKQQHVEDNLRKISGLELPETSQIIGSEKTQFYRNKLEFTFSDNRWLTNEEIESGTDLNRVGLGFHIPKMFDKILDIEKCYLQEDPSNQIRDKVKEIALRNNFGFYNIREHKGFLRNLIIRITSIGEVMVILQVAEDDQEAITKILEEVKTHFSEVKSLMYVINQKKNDTFYDLPVTLFHGKGYISEKMGDLTFKIGPKSFYQTNSLQAKVLYDLVVDFADFQGHETVYDLYTGTGTIANYVAGKVTKVIGVESVPEAVEDAQVNSHVNKVKNTEFYAGDMKDMLSEEFVGKHGKPDIIITDPPRVGMHKNVVERLLDLEAHKIVYVSCNPATQARDLELLSSKYKVIRIQPVDMFPQTHHVECIVLLKLK